MFAFLLMRTGDLVPELLSCAQYSRADHSHKPCVTPPGLTSSLKSVPLERLHAISRPLILKSTVTVEAVGMVTLWNDMVCGSGLGKLPLVCSVSGWRAHPLAADSRLAPAAAARAP